MSAQSWAGVRERLLRVGAAEAADGQSVTGQSVSELFTSKQTGSDTPSPDILSCAAECVAPPSTADEAAHLNAFLGISLPRITAHSYVRSVRAALGQTWSSSSLRRSLTTSGAGKELTGR